MQRQLKDPQFRTLLDTNVPGFMADRKPQLRAMFVGAYGPLRIALTESVAKQIGLSEKQRHSLITAAVQASRECDRKFGRFKSSIFLEIMGTLNVRQRKQLESEIKISVKRMAGLYEWLPCRIVRQQLAIDSKDQKR